MRSSVIKVIGEGGTHLHQLESPIATFKDGVHKHLYFIQDRLIMTELDGAHWHPIDATNNSVGLEAQPRHKHVIAIRSAEGVQNFQTDEGTEHPHELQTQNTTLSGLHTHMLTIGEETWISLLPGDLIREVEEQAKKVPGLKDFKVAKRNDPMEMDYSLVKKLNTKIFSKVLQKSVLRAQIKNLVRLGDGLRIHSLILSKERFDDIGIARRFVMDHGLNVRGSQDKDHTFVFQTLSNDKFQEATLQRVRLTEGVDAVVGFLKDEFKPEETQEAARAQEASAADSLPENATQSESTQESRTETLDSLEDNNPAPRREAPMEMSDLKAKLKKLQSIYTEKQRRGSAVIQTLIFSKKTFSRSEAVSWARDHDFKSGKVDTNEKSIRLRQRPPGDFQDKTFRTIRLTSGVQAVVGRLKEEKKILRSDFHPPEDKKDLPAFIEMILKKKKTKRNEGEPVKIGDFKVGDFVSYSLGTGENTEFHTGEIRSISMEATSEDLEVTEDDPVFQIARLKRNLDGEMSFTGETDSKKLSEVDSTRNRIAVGKSISLTMPICKQDSEKRLVTGPVLIPESIDLQDEVISADEIEMSSINFMVKLNFQGDPEFLSELGLNTRADRGFMHSEFNRKIAIVENYVAPVNFELNGRKIIKGTWVMTVKVFDDEVWNLIKAGKINGFSIGGRAKLIDETGKTKMVDFMPTHYNFERVA